MIGARGKKGAATSVRLSPKRLKGLPGQAASLLRAATGFLDAGDTERAGSSASLALALAPDHAECLRVVAAVQSRRGNFRDALNCLRKALALQPDDPTILSECAAALGSMQEHEEAIAILRRVCSLKPDADSWLALGLMCDRDARHGEALDSAKRVLQLQTSNTGARLLCARSLQATGRTDEAATEYREVIAQGREVSKAWFGLVDTKTVRLSDDELRQLKQHAESTKLGDDERAIVHFALGKALEDAGLYDQAYSTFVRANTIKRRNEHWNATAFSRHVDAIITAFEQPVARAECAQGNEVIFIVGLPRSGSTLIEQIISAHPDVEGASELPYLNTIISEESRRRGSEFPSWATAATREDWRRLGQEYLDRSRRWRQERPRATDKLPENWLYAAAVVAMLPHARIIDCRRDALETCWSCYKQLFAPGRVGFTYDFGDLAAYWRDYVRFSDHMQRRHPDNFRLQSYEKLIASPEAEIRDLLDFCGLPFAAACLRPHEAPRTIRTASAAQVRQPMHGGTARAKSYGALLKPLESKLDQAIPS